MRRIALAAVIVSVPVCADANDSMIIANQLGFILASEQPCELQFDAEAVQKYIEKSVAADDMGFASSLNIQTIGAGVMIEEMTPTQRAAHCAHVTRVAHANAFIN